MINFVATDAEKNKFFNCQLYKGDIGQNLEKMKKIDQGAPTSQNKQKQILKQIQANSKINNYFHPKCQLTWFILQLLEQIKNMHKILL